MRVLLVSFDSPLSMHGGVEWYTHHLAQALGAQGVDVRVLSRRPGPDAPETFEGVRYEWAPLPPSGGPTTIRYRLRHEPGFWRAARKAAPDFDIVHSQNTDAFGARKAKPLVATVHTTPLDEWPSARLGGWREWLYQREIEEYRRIVWRAFVRKAAHIWTPGAHVAKSLRTLGARDVEILANPVPPLRSIAQEEARRALGLPSGRPLLLFLGRLAPVKRPHRVLEAARELPDAFVAIAGEGPEKERLEAIAKEPGLMDRVRFLGRVDERAKELLLNAADVVVLPSEHEGQPLVLLEALAVGTPIVATRAEWVPPELTDRGEFGEDLPDLIRRALRRERKPAPVIDHAETARRMRVVYERVGRR